MWIKFYIHFINCLLTFKVKSSLIYISNIEAYYQYFNLMKNFIQMFNNVNKSYVLQHNFKIYIIN